MNLREELVSRLTARLVPVLQGTTSILVRAEDELYPRPVAEALVQHLGERVLSFTLSQAVEEEDWAQDVRTTDVLLLTCDEAAGIEDGLGTVVRRAAERGATPVVVVLSVSESPAPDEVVDLFQVVLGRESLVVIDEDLAGLGDDWTDVARRHDLLRVTAGVPALVVAAAEELEEDPDGPALTVRVSRSSWTRVGEGGAGPLQRAAGSWADRVTSLLRAEDVALLRCLVPITTARGIALVASAVLGREVSVEDVRATDAAPGMIVHSADAAGPPPALAAEVVRRVLTDDPNRAAALRHALTSFLLDPDIPLSPGGTLSALVGLKAWAALDRHLGRHAYVLTLLTSAQRRALTALLPLEVPGSWTHLSRTKQLVSMEGITPCELPQPWLNLLWATGIVDHESIEGLVLELRDRVTAAVSQAHSPDRELQTRAFDEARAWIDAEVSRLHAEASRSYLISNATARDAMLLGVAMLGFSDASSSLGRITEAQRVLKRAFVLAEAFTIFPAMCPVLRTGLAARRALVAAHAGARERAEQYLADYEEVVLECGAREPEPEHIVQVARRLLADCSLGTVRVTADIDDNTTFTPMEVEAEALLILIQRGPDAAIEWIHIFLGRSQWTDLLSIEWWPLHVLLAVIEIREGRVGNALRIVQDNEMPESAVLLIRAGAALERGNHAECLDLTRELASLRSTSPRTALLGHGYRVGALLLAGEDVSTDLDTSTASWASSPATVALLPDLVRQLVLPLIDTALAAQPGLRSTEGGTEAVSLTPRQMDVLTLMAQGSTLPEIAEDLFLGVETVRSTSKAIYKRLGVHDRDAAVRVARLSGLI